VGEINDVTPDDQETSDDDFTLTIALSAGFGLLAIIIIIAIILLACRRCRKKANYSVQYSNNGIAYIDVDQDNVPYFNVPADKTGNNAIGYCGLDPFEPVENKDYSAQGAYAQAKQPSTDKLVDY